MEEGLNLGRLGGASAAKFRLSGWLVWFLRSCFLVNFVIYCFCQQVRSLEEVGFILYGSQVTGLR